MTAKYELDEDENKSFDEDYTYCNQCEWNGIPNQKIAIVYLDIKRANELELKFKCEVSDYSENGNNEVHRHNYDPGLSGHTIAQSWLAS